MGQPASRIGDMHTCPMQTPGTPPIPHVGGPILGPCVPTVLTGMIPQATIGDMCTCIGPPDTIVKGSPTVLVMNKPAARIGDATVHGGVIVMGFPTVLIGDAGGGAGGGGGGVAVARTGAGEGAFDEFQFTPWETSAAESSQAKVMKQAASDGTPFCEKCQR